MFSDVEIRQMPAYQLRTHVKAMQQLIHNAVRRALADRPADHPAWAAVRDVFAVNHNLAAQVLVNKGLDPETGQPLEATSRIEKGEPVTYEHMELIEFRGRIGKLPEADQVKVNAVAEGMRQLIRGAGEPGIFALYLLCREVSDGLFDDIPRINLPHV